MSRLPYPGLLTEQEKANLESVRSKDVNRYEYFKFNISQIEKPKLIFKIPEGGILYTRITGKVIEPFTSAGFLYFGTVADYSDVAKTPVNVPGAFTAQWEGGSDYYMHIFTKLTPIYIVIKLATESNVGSGFGIIQWLDLGKVPSYRRNK